MKKQISVEGEGLAALNNIVGSASFNSRTDARKIHTLAQCLVKPMAGYRAAMEAIQDKFGEEVVEGEGDKAKKKMVVPDSKVKDYTSAIDEERSKKYDVQFDKESFSFCIVILDQLFDREEIKKQNGLSGIDQARNLNQISVAFDLAVDV